MNVHGCVINDKQIELVRFREIATPEQGVATGDNKYYLYQNPNARGSYRDIDEVKDHLITEYDLGVIRNDERLRLKIIQKGFAKNDPSKDTYFAGRYILPYDKGGESDASEGWLPNYYVPTNYFIEWSEEAVERLRTYTIAQRIIDNKEKKAIKPQYYTTNAAILRNSEDYFREGITFSRTGIYAPTFRLGTGSVFDTEGSTIFLTRGNIESMMGILCSKMTKATPYNTPNLTNPLC